MEWLGVSVSKIHRTCTLHNRVGPELTVISHILFGGGEVV